MRSVNFLQRDLNVGRKLKGTCDDGYISQVQQDLGCCAALIALQDYADSKDWAGNNNKRLHCYYGCKMTYNLGLERADKALVLYLECNPQTADIVDATVIGMIIAENYGYCYSDCNYNV
eukprot:TRINITY_DN4333_c0_g1_i8.p4 TRINITY_DN4333_c0_g1~~TRINITY_DN4333_c0_g1_i8.p4  ORF type:complete len:119 (-),score=13.21 TRINITY_DN4333_c0_g1_i8:81-437(-)